MLSMPLNLLAVLVFLCHATRIMTVAVVSMYTIPPPRPPANRCVEEYSLEGMDMCNAQYYGPLVMTIDFPESRTVVLQSHRGVICF